MSIIFGGGGVVNIVVFLFFFVAADVFVFFRFTDGVVVGRLFGLGKIVWHDFAGFWRSSFAGGVFSLVRLVVGGAYKR